MASPQTLLGLPEVAVEPMEGEGAIGLPLVSPAKIVLRMLLTGNPITAAQTLSSAPLARIVRRRMA